MAHHAANEEEVDMGVVGQQVQDGEAVSDHAYVLLRQIRAHEFERGAAAEEDGIAGRDGARRRHRRRAFLVDVETALLFV